VFFRSKDKRNKHQISRWKLGSIAFNFFFRIGNGCAPQVRQQQQKEAKQQKEKDKMVEKKKNKKKPIKKQSKL
jgi:cell division protein FtsB